MGFDINKKWHVYVQTDSVWHIGPTMPQARDNSVAAPAHMSTAVYARRLIAREKPLTHEETWGRKAHRDANGVYHEAIQGLVAPLQAGQQYQGYRPVVVKEAQLSPQERIFASDVGLSKHKGVWRPLKGSGEIHGLPRSRGIAVATNGVLIAIDIGSKELFIGHATWWIADEEEDADELEASGVKPSVKRKSKREKLLETLLA